jgi:hypothetical protein
LLPIQLADGGLILQGDGHREATHTYKASMVIA